MNDPSTPALDWRVRLQYCARLATWQDWAARLARLWPGVALCGVVALAATAVAGLQGGPPMLYALFFGMVFHHQSHDPRSAAGVRLCMRVVLRLGVGLLGARITADQVAGLGWVTAAAVVVLVGTTLGCGVLLARWLRLPAHLGWLAGGATAICGAAAALAIAAVLPRHRLLERDTVAVVVMATALSTLAMLFYPSLVRLLGLSPAAAGVFVGGSIHDVAQVVVTGYAIGPQTGDVASIVKLMRVSLLVAVVGLLAFAMRRDDPSMGDRAPPAGIARHLPAIPAFLLLFVLLVAARSAGWIAPAAASVLHQVSQACLLVGVTALGMHTSFAGLVRTGWRPMLLMAMTTAWIMAVALGAASLPR